MPQLPVISSILSTIPLQNFLQSKYDFKSPIKLKLLKAGINHSYFLLDGEKEYIFRIYTLNWRSKKEITAELNLLIKLKSENLPVSYPLKNQQDTYVLDIAAPEGLRFGVLFSYAEGEKRFSYGESTHQKIGQVMARFHQLTEGDVLDRATYTAEVVLMDSLKKIRSFLPEGTAEMKWMEQTQKELLQLWESANKQELRRGTVHLDIWPDNFNITEEGEATLFDFDFCGNGWQCLDIAYYILQLHNLEKDENIRKVKLEAFLAGYESVQKISAEERRLLHGLGVSLYYFYLGVQCGRYEDWSNVFLTESYLKKYVEVLVKGYREIKN